MQVETETAPLTEIRGRCIICGEHTSSLVAWTGNRFEFLCAPCGAAVRMSDEFLDSENEWEGVT